MPKEVKSYLNLMPQTIIGFYRKDTPAETITKDFNNMIVTNQSRAGNLYLTKCSDWYYNRDNIKNIYGHYFGFYALPKWIFKLVEEMNDFFKSWDIKIVCSREFYIISGFSDTKLKRYAKPKRVEDIGYSVLLQVVPDRNIRRRKGFEDVFNIIQLYMHHIFRTASLHHANNIDNNFIPKNRFKKSKYPHLEYVLYKSYHTRNSGKNLYNRGCLTLEDLNLLNDTHRLFKLLRAHIETSYQYRYRGSSKTYQSDLMDALRNFKQFTKGQLVYNSTYNDGIYFKSYFVKYSYIGTVKTQNLRGSVNSFYCHQVLTREEFLNLQKEGKIPWQKK